MTSANLCYPTTRLRSYFSTIFAAHLRVYTRKTGCKRGFTSHRTCKYVLLTEKNRRICKALLRYTCNFMTESQGLTDPAMKIYMHIFYACRQYGHKCSHFSRVTYKGLACVHFPCKCCKISPFTYIVCMCCKIHSHLYKPTVQPVASRRLFFDLQVVTLLLVEFACLHIFSNTPLPGYVYVF